ncbi:MAG: ACP S-malonyltransferase [Gemmatimonadales bacterium]
MVSVLVFPGQGAQKIGMARDLAERFPMARSTLQNIEAALEIPLTRIMWEGPEETLLETSNTQPAILAHSAAVLSVVGKRIGQVVGAAGHSLGEYSALMAAGVLSPTDAAKLVRRRGELMHQAGTQRPGAMSAVLGLAAEQVVDGCRAASAEGQGVVVAANVNAPDQTVISGDPAAVTAAGERLKAAGAKRVLPLKVSGAFHSPLMEPAETGLRKALDGVSFADPTFPVVANATAQPVRTGRDAKNRLVDQLTAPVRWVECVQALARLAPEIRFVEIGPGTVLSGLIKRIVPGAQVQSLGTAAELEAFLG